MEKTSFTYYFEEIFPDYETWKDFIDASSYIDLTDATNLAFDEYCFNLLYRHFNHQNIRYSTIDAFLGELLNVYENKFEQFKKEKSLIDTIYSLTNDDLQLISTALTNMANNPNDDVADPLSPLSFISAQTFQQTQSNKLKAYLDALNNMPSLNIYKFFRPNNEYEMGFNDLFMNVQPNIKYLYKKEGE